MTIVQKDCISIKIKGTIVDLYTEEMDLGLNTVAEIDGKYHYLGDVVSNVAVAIYVWQFHNERVLSTEEVLRVL